MTKESGYSFYSYWGKVKEGKDGEYSWHLLPYHCLDVAATGKAYLESRHELLKSICEALQCDLAEFVNWFSFLLSIHDLGKFSSSFQSLKKGLSEELTKAENSFSYSERHDTIGFVLWKKELRKEWKNKSQFEGHAELDNSTLDFWFGLSAGHHGIPARFTNNRGQELRGKDYFEKWDKDNARLFLEEVTKLFFPGKIPTQLICRNINKSLKKVSWQLAGVITLSDWIGSNQENFGYLRDSLPLEEYWEAIALPKAKEAVEKLPSNAPQVRKFDSMRHLFPFIKQATPLQKMVENIPLDQSPQLFILEDVTGAGKTEAALILSHHLMEAGLADGIYIGLPTMATAFPINMGMNRYKRCLKSSTVSVPHKHGDEPSIALLQ